LADSERLCRRHPSVREIHRRHLGDDSRPERNLPGCLGRRIVDRAPPDPEASGLLHPRAVLDPRHLLAVLDLRHPHRPDNPDPAVPVQSTRAHANGIPRDPDLQDPGSADLNLLARRDCAGQTTKTTERAMDLWNLKNSYFYWT
jgi:hypothetical protein